MRHATVMGMPGVCLVYTVNLALCHHGINTANMVKTLPCNLMCSSVLPLGTELPPQVMQKV